MCALWPICYCISQAAVRYSVATHAVDAGHASGRNVGVAADSDWLGSRQNGTTIPPRHQANTRRVFGNRPATKLPVAASAACLYSFLPARFVDLAGSDRRGTRVMPPPSAVAHY